MMQKRHYELIAKALAESIRRANIKGETRERLVLSFGNALSDTNPKYDNVRFQDAVNDALRSR